jgi:Ca-activated chloride channel homolog
MLQIVGLTAALLASGPANGSAADVPSFAAQTELVILSAQALDKKGRPVRDLGRAEIRVFEEGKAQELVHFARSEDLEARVLLLVDMSGSMAAASKIANARMAAAQLLSALGPRDQVALAGFDDRYFGLVPFTRDRGRIESVLAEVETFGATALHDALERAVGDIVSHGEGRRAIVVLSDGGDNASQRTADQVIETSRAVEVPIYALSLLSPLDDPQSRVFVGTPAEGSVLGRFATLSGGLAFTVSDLQGLDRAARQIMQEVKHQYRLGYTPPAGPRGFRRIEIRSTRKGVTIRTRSGYLPQGGVRTTQSLLLERRME